MSNDSPFNILGSDKVPSGEAKPVQENEQSKEQDLNKRIEDLINSSDIFLFMKGTPEMPQCGFSANVVAILQRTQKDFKTFDVLSDWDVRQGIKEYANWPTIPQLYYKGKFLGGNDIVMEMFEDGELEEVLNR